MQAIADMIAGVLVEGRDPEHVRAEAIELRAAHQTSTTASPNNLQPMAVATELDLETLKRVEQRVLWLATSIVHHANRVRENRSGVKVGGHQASSASMVSLMTALYFGVLEAPDRVSVKPHASPVLHAINHLLGRLDRALPDDAARVRRPAVLPVAHEGPGPGRLLHRLRRPRRHRADLGRARAPLRRRPLRRPARRPPDRADRRRRARRGRLLGGDRGPDGQPPRRGHVGRRPQPAVAGPRRPRHRRRPARRDVRGRRLAHGDGQVRPAAAQAPRPDGPHRRDAQRGVPAAAARRRARAPAAHRGATSTTSTTTSCWPPSATSAATTSPACSTATARRTRSSTARASSSPTRSRAGRCRPRATPPTTPRCSTTRSTASWRPSWARTRTTRSSRSRPARPRRSCARRRDAAQARRRRRAVPAPKVPHDLGRKHTGAASTQQAFGRFFVDLVREAPEVADARRDRLARRGHLHQPRRLDQQGRHLEPRRADRLVRRRHRHARALARVRPRPPHRARHRRGQPRRRARRARRDLVARRPAAAAGRDDLRPVRAPRAGAVVVRDLRGRPVDPRRHALRRHARPRGRRPPVGDHAEHRHRAARLRRLRARVRPGLRVVLPARALPARQAGRHERLLPALHAPDRPVAPHRDARGGARRRLPAQAARRAATS